MGPIWWQDMDKYSTYLSQMKGNTLIWNISWRCFPTSLLVTLHQTILHAVVWVQHPQEEWEQVELQAKALQDLADADVFESKSALVKQMFVLK